MAEKRGKKESLPTTLTYAVDTITVKKGDEVAVGPSDLLFLGGAGVNYTFVVLRRLDP